MDGVEVLIPLIVIVFAKFAHRHRIDNAEKKESADNAKRRSKVSPAQPGKKSRSSQRQSVFLSDPIASGQ